MDLGGVLRLQEVLRPPAAKQAGGINHDHFPLTGRGFVVPKHQHTGRKPGAIEEVRSKANHRLHQIGLEQVLADLTLHTTAE